MHFVLFLALNPFIILVIYGFILIGTSGISSTIGIIKSITCTYSCIIVYTFKTETSSFITGQTRASYAELENYGWSATGQNVSVWYKTQNVTMSSLFREDFVDDKTKRGTLVIIVACCFGTIVCLVLSMMKCRNTAQRHEEKLTNIPHMTSQVFEIHMGEAPIVLGLKDGKLNNIVCIENP